MTYPESGRVYCSKRPMDDGEDSSRMAEGRASGATSPTIIGSGRPGFDAARLEMRLAGVLGGGLPHEAAEYVVSTIVGELEEARISSIEDVYGVLQTFVPEEMLKDDLKVEDDDDMEVLVCKIWAALDKEGALPREEESETVEEAWGGCELCERDMPLTRHHLKPRSTHKKYLKQGLTQEELNLTASICRPCHSAVHRTHSNEMLASSYDTVERLLGDEKIMRFVVWARSQRLRTKQDSLNPKIHYPR